MIVSFLDKFCRQSLETWQQFQDAIMIFFKSVSLSHRTKISFTGEYGLPGSLLICKPESAYFK